VDNEGIQNGTLEEKFQYIMDNLKLNAKKYSVDQNLRLSDDWQH
jgi:hypothetical protein